jgi:hypothetical protein
MSPAEAASRGPVTVNKVDRRGRQSSGSGWGYTVTRIG